MQTMPTWVHGVLAKLRGNKPAAATPPAPPVVPEPAPAPEPVAAAEPPAKEG
jgi:hypothetical protein